MRGGSSYSSTPTSRNRASQNPLSAALAQANKVISKKDDYAEPCNKNNKNVKMLAQQIGPKEAISSHPGLQSALPAIKESLKKIALKNIKSKKLLDRRVAVLKEIADGLSRQIMEEDDEERNKSSNADGEGSESKPATIDYKKFDKPPVDYNEIFSQKMENGLTNQAKAASASDESHEWYTKLRKIIGEDQQSKSAKKSKKRSKGGDDDSDDDLEVVEDVASKEKELICQISICIFVKPMKSSKCDHVFSLDPLKQWLKNSNKCPVAGCKNKNMLLSQFECDDDMESRVERHERRMAKRAKKNAESDDEDAL
ncbi:hypothetical protein ScalyP_jg9042 [Parmales sp. scaly parma]|nr:hypothetical protein ScalyP_jg9042 [Parmales sp. scaly parma]